MSSARGIKRERQVRVHLEEDGWFVARAAGSLGDADLIALKAGHTSKLIEVKSTTAGPFHSFGPACRQALLNAAERAGAGYLDIYSAVNGTTTASANSGVVESKLLWQNGTVATWNSASWGSDYWGN